MSARRILIVDDSESNLRLFKALLAHQAYEVRGARDASEALCILETFLPDLLLLDLRLPGMDGLSLTRKLRADERTRHITIIAVTAHAMKGDEARARAAGVDDYLSKPVDKNVFRARVAEALGGV